MVLFVGAIFSFNALANSYQPIKTDPKAFSKTDVPAQLKSWEAWALDGYEKNNCVFSYDRADNKICYFISSLNLDVRGKELSFTQKVSIKQKGYVLIPGSFEVFPYTVQANGQSVPVINLLGLPYVALDKGEYTLVGKAKSKEDIRYFSIPVEVAVLSVKKDGAEVINPATDSGVLRLESISAAKKETDDISYTVFRKIDDSIPMWMTMRIDINVSGSQRVENLGKIIPENFAVLDINSSIPAHIQKNGEMMAEVSAGNWWIEVTFRQINESLNLKVDASPVEQEIWVFQKDTSRRAIQVPTTVQQIQTKTTSMPDGWKSLPGYELKKGENFTLGVVEYQEKQKDNISLARQIKLSFDGKFYSIKDNINGQLKEDGQVSLNKPFELSSIEVNSVPQSIVITKDGDPGFEIRKGSTNITAISQISSKVRKINATGFDREFDSANWTLTLSPGYKLFHASGADSVSNSWIASWNLLSIFMVVLLGVIFFYLFGWKKALLAEATFILMQPVMPSFIIISFVLCGIVGVERFIGKESPISKFVGFMKYSLFAFLALAIIGFMIQNIRFAMYPGLNNGYIDHPLMLAINYYFLTAFYFWAAVIFWVYKICAKKDRDTVVKVFLSIVVFVLAIVASSVISFVVGIMLDYMPMPMLGAASQHRYYHDEVYYEEARAPSAVMDMVAYKEVSGSIRSLGKSKNIANQKLAEGYVNNDAKLAKYQSVSITRNRIQTGVGFPEWSDGYNNIRISINGPVGQEDAFGIYLLSPFVNLLIAFAQLLLSVVVLYYLLDRGGEKIKEMVSKKTKKTVAKTVAILFACLMIVKPASANEIPSTEVLNELRTKLTREEKPSCMPNCATIPNAVINMEGNEVVVDMLVHAQDNIVVPLPSIRADGGGFVKVTGVVVNNNVNSQALKKNDVLNVLVNKGVNNVRIRASLEGGIDRFSIASAIKISLLQNISDKFEVSENAGSSQIYQVKIKNRADMVKASSGISESSKIEVMPFFEVTRNLDIGTIWQVTTTVRKINKTSESSSIEIPLLDGEKVISSEGNLLKDKIMISFGTNEISKEYVSILPVEQKIMLKSQPKMLNYREVWLLNVDLAWSFDTKGIKAISSNSDEATYIPSAGDVLEVDVYRAKSFEGEVITFDRVDYSLSYGRSKIGLNVSLKARSSEGGNHEIVLPKGAEVKELSIDGQNYPISQKDNVLVVPVNNGATTIAFGVEMKKDVRNIWTFPAIDLKAPAVNIYENLTIASDRWVLFAHGPVKGPAVLFWSQVPIWILLAFVFAKLKIGNISGLSWFVLLLGLSQSRMLFSIVVVTWFMVMTVRDRYSDKLVMKKLIQLCIPVLTLLFVFCLIKGVSNGLLGTWDMKIAGNGSFSNWGSWTLKWYQDAVTGLLPSPFVVSLPLWAYRTLMVLWSIWLSFSLVKWFKWGAKAYQKDGMWNKG